MEPYDSSPVEAALREAFEEVQLNPGLVQVVGFLGKVLSPANLLLGLLLVLFAAKMPLIDLCLIQPRWI